MPIKNSNKNFHVFKRFSYLKFFNSFNSAFNGGMVVPIVKKKKSISDNTFKNGKYKIRNESLSNVTEKGFLNSS